MTERLTPIKPPNGNFSAEERAWRNGITRAVNSGFGATSLSDLSDINITSPQENDFLQYDGSKWINTTFTPSATAWGSISGNISDQTDLYNILGDKVDSSSLSAVATSGDYDDLLNKPTIPTVNDATLTIQKNGTTVDTFTANASSNKTINIVETIQSANSPLSITSNALSISQASSSTDGYLSSTDWTSFNSKLSSTIFSSNNSWTGTNTFRNIVPESDNTYDIGSSSAMLKEIYGKIIRTTDGVDGGVYFHKTSTLHSYVRGVSDDTLQLHAQRLIQFNLQKNNQNQTLLVLKETELRPTGTFDLGTSTYKYNNVYTNNIVLGGTSYNSIPTATSNLTNDSGFITSSDIPALPSNTDLSDYDNSVSGFITSSDIPALPSDTDLSHYDNTTSGFITGISNLDDIGDVEITSPQDTQLLKYSSALGKWVNGSASAVTVNWGDIAGTLSNQTDLQSALNLKANAADVPTDTNDLTNGAGFITSSDIPALPSDTDLSHYNNTTSDFVNSTTLSTALAAKQNVIDANNQLSVSYIDGLGSCATLGYDNSSIKVLNGNLYVAGKQAQLNGTGFVKASGTTISYDNSTYFKTSGGTISGAVTITSELTARTVVKVDNSSTTTYGRMGYDSSSRFWFRNGTSGGKYLANGGTAWQDYSDRRIKKNIVDLDSSLEKVLALKPVKFDYITDETDNSDRVGFIAQDVYSVIPEAVDGTPDQEGYMGLGQETLIPFLVKAVQELSAKVEALKLERV